MLPPGQQLAAAGKWPMVGERMPRRSDAPWTLTVCGCIERPRVWSLAEIESLPQVERVIDIHCVTRWSKLGMTFRGVPLQSLLDLAQPTADARYISFVARSERDHSTSLPLADALALGTLFALRADGEPISSDHGGPLRTVVPRRYFYKSLKWLERIELLAEDELGFWEGKAGYHNHADPLLEERYIAANLTRMQVAKVLAARDFSDLDLRSIDVRGRDLTGLKAERALLRDADFRGLALAGANFNAANLSNAHFAEADLRGASFAEADVEGADFTGADLSGADFRGASLLGVTFCSATTEAELAASSGAIVDAATRFDAALLDQLCPVQAAYLRARLPV